MTDVNYTDDLKLLSNTPAEAKSLLQVAGGIGLYMNANEKKIMSFKQEGALSTLSVKPLNLVDLVLIPRQPYLIY